MIKKLEHAIDDATNCAREIYYAKACIDEGNFVGAQTILDRALSYLDVAHPHDVGLSVSALYRRKSHEEVEDV